MYRIKNDKRSLNSIQLISDGFLKCLEKKSFEKISIVDIQKTTHISRATFYRYFDSTFDVLIYQIDKIFKNFIERHNEKDLKEAIVYFFEKWLERKEILRAIISCNRTYIIVETFEKYKLKDKILEKKLNLLKREKYIVRIIGGIMASILIVNFMEKEEITGKELFEIFKLSIKEIYKNIF